MLHGKGDAPTWTASRARTAYIDFFTNRQHTYVSSSSVVLNDPTLLFVNAGMNQFKSAFLGQVCPTSSLLSIRRAVNSQKCIRAGGKHNDLDDVGRDLHHHTFFEMLGNWSFGDYFKEEAIDYSWELLTDVYKLDPGRLYVSYFGGDAEIGLTEDEETRRLWERHLPPGRIIPFGKENFWEMGVVGPCGPCSEIHYDRIGGRDAAALVNSDPDVVEIWNLVFMQFNRDVSGSLLGLPRHHIDTGMGFERLLSILQHKKSNYDTDLFAPLFSAVLKLVGGEPYGGRVGTEDEGLRDTAYRVLVDHARTLTVAIADGVVPSKEGRGYVLRRILRRAVRYGRLMGAPPGFLHDLVPAVIETLADAFPELSSAADRVRTVIKQEETVFDLTVERGMAFFREIQSELLKNGKNIVSGDQAFHLYDSHGFPLDLTQQMALEAGLSVETSGFDAAMERQKKTSRVARKQVGQDMLDIGVEQISWLSAHIYPTSDKSKYEWDVSPVATIKAIYSEDGFAERSSAGMVGVVLDRTSFYAEAGGQVSDVGLLRSAEADVLQVQSVRRFGGFVLHMGMALMQLEVGAKVTCCVDYAHRRAVAANHTMTHALNWALREVLGAVDQRGSLVTANKLRFDFTASRVDLAQLQRTEDLVRQLIRDALPVTCFETSVGEARKIGLLGDSEGYPELLRVVSIGTSDLAARNSVELCGGTHVSNTRDAGHFVVLEESAVAKGIRRIVAATGDVAKAAHVQGRSLEQLVAQLECSPDLAQVTKLGKQLESATVSAVLKERCRVRIGSVRKAMKKALKKKHTQEEPPTP